VVDDQDLDVGVPAIQLEAELCGKGSEDGGEQVGLGIASEGKGVIVLSGQADGGGSKVA